MSAPVPQAAGRRLPCGCQVHSSESGMGITPRCAEHAKNPGALAALASQSAVHARDVVATTTAATPTTNFTYSGNPGATQLDQVRFLLGDTNPNAPYLQDGEILWLLSDADGDALSAAIRGCEVIMAKLSGARDESVGSVSISFSQSAMGFSRLIKTLQMRMGKRALPFAGGLSRTDKIIARADRNLVQPEFRRDMMQWNRCAETGWGASSFRQLWPSEAADELTYGDAGISGREISAGYTDGGNRIIVGTTDPTVNTPGEPGEYYFNVTTKTLFGPYQ